MKYCEDCKHYRVSFSDWFFRLKHHGKCAASIQRLPYHVVSRQAEPSDECVHARGDYGACGADATLFEPRE